MNDFRQGLRLALPANSAFIEAWQHLRKDTHMDGRCITQNELPQRWQVSESTLERWRSQRTGPMFLRLGGQVRYRITDVEAFETQAPTEQKADIQRTSLRNAAKKLSPNLPTNPQSFWVILGVNEERWWLFAQKQT